jgi:nitrite reductase/ring-hydroxylating ferredoxin subunit
MCTVSDKFIRAISTVEITPGGMKTVAVDGHEIVICNCGGSYYAIERRCGHMNAPLELGTLDGKVVTCPMHCAQFDVTTGQALSGPVPANIGDENPPPVLVAYLQRIDNLMKRVRTESIRTYETKIEAGWVEVTPSFPSFLPPKTTTEGFNNGDEIQGPKPLTDFYGEDRHELVQKFAYERWEKRGRPLGSPELDWFPAERAARSYLLTSGIPLGPDQDLYR